MPLVSAHDRANILSLFPLAVLTVDIIFPHLLITSTAFRRVLRGMRHRRGLACVKLFPSDGTSMPFQGPARCKRNRKSTKKCINLGPPSSTRLFSLSSTTWTTLLDDDAVDMIIMLLHGVSLFSSAFSAQPPWDDITRRRYDYNNGSSARHRLFLYYLYDTNHDSSAR